MFSYVGAGCQRRTTKCRDYTSSPLESKFTGLSEYVAALTSDDTLNESDRLLELLLDEADTKLVVEPSPFSVAPRKPEM